MKKSHVLAIAFIATSCFLFGQEWSLKLKSQVELRTWKLTTKADKTEKSIQGATILLLSGTTVIKEVQSDLEGNFEIDIPANGDYYLSVSYPGCNSKKFYVSTKNIPDDQNKGDFKPSVRIGGFMMSKPFKGIDYLGLEQPLLKVEYKNKAEGFDKDVDVSTKGVNIVSNIMDAEEKLIEKFCNNTKLGDEALNRKNYKLAKNYYLKALELIPGEEYPKLKLEKAESGIKEEDAKKESIAEEQAAQVAASKEANQKAIEQKQAQEKAMFDKAAAASKEKELQKKGPITNASTASETTESTVSKGKSKHKVAQPIGAHTYKSNVDKGDAYFKSKHYGEAKKSYTAALKYKENDEYAKGKIEEINKLLGVK